MTLGVAALYLFFGTLPDTVAERPWPLETTIAKDALNRSIERMKPIDDPVAATDENLIAGATIFKQHCAMCHGLPGQESLRAHAMAPAPPDDFWKYHGAKQKYGETDDPPDRIYWYIDNGVRLSGMPSFQSILTQRQIWQVVTMMKHANVLPAPAQTILRPS